MDIRIRGSPSRCPYCKDSIGDVREIVACALCGARHHVACREQHGRCAVCSSTELLVYKKTDEPLAARGLFSSREGEIVTYRWPLMAKDGLALVSKTGFLRLEPRALAFLAAHNRELFEVRAERAQVGEVVFVGKKILIEADEKEHALATESIGYALSAGDLSILDAAIRAWKRA